MILNYDISHVKDTQFRLWKQNIIKTVYRSDVTFYIMWWCAFTLNHVHKMEIPLGQRKKKDS